MNYRNLNKAYEFYDNSLNINNNRLETCGTNPMTGFYRNGKCETGADDKGTHTVCAKVNNEFLEFTKNMGNDLSTPTSYFPGLKEGDNWCLCALRWKQAYDAGKAPPVIENATNKMTLSLVPDFKNIMK